MRPDHQSRDRDRPPISSACNRFSRRPLAPPGWPCSMRRPGCMRSRISGGVKTRAMQARCDIDTLGLRNAGTPTQAFTGSTEVRGASFGLVAALARNCEQLGRRFDVRRRGAALGGIHGAYAPLASRCRTRDRSRFGPRARYIRAGVFCLAGRRPYGPTAHARARVASARPKGAGQVWY